MKSLKEVEKNRIEYHTNPYKNTVHRSSLLVPIMDNCETIVTFLNHFLIKRGIKDTSCKITGYDGNGTKIDSTTVELYEEKVYVIEPIKLFKNKPNTVNIEFYSGKNLFFPFPAVIINHRNEFFNNFVHSYNRILNDVDEDDQINSKNFTESAIDVIKNEEFESFFVFSSGVMDVDSFLNFTLAAKGKIYSKKVNIIQKKLSFRMFKLSEIYPELDNETIDSGVMKINQPKQFMFFGRMLVGVQSKSSFIANHSYYDSSGVEEYWDNDKLSLRQYPFFHNLNNKIIFYPIMSPSNLDVFLELRENSNHDEEIFVGSISSPGEEVLKLNINEIIEKNNIKKDNISSFVIKCKNREKGNPTRINHQLIYERKNGLASSINMSLVNENTFNPPNKKGFSWGQIFLSSDYDSFLGITVNKPVNSIINYSLKFYNSHGIIGEKHRSFHGYSADVFYTNELLELFENITREDYIWYSIESNHPDLYAYSLNCNLKSHHISGEHSF